MLKIVLSREQLRSITQAGFYLLFLTAPLLDVFRFDVLNINFIIFGQRWMMGFEISDLACFDIRYSAQNVFLNFLLPILVFIILSGLVAWKYGRIYCGWLCPHFSVVETINRLMLKYLDQTTFWEKSPAKKSAALAWLFVLIICVIIAFIWSFALLGYFYPPKLIISGLLNFDLSMIPSLFLLFMTIILTLDFYFVRHLFCKFGCSFGILQSLAWMANNNAMVIGFDKSRANLCQMCDSQCDKSCPMNLPVRGVKRAKSTCTQCGVCLTACDKAQSVNPRGRLIHWEKNTE